MERSLLSKTWNVLCPFIGQSSISSHHAIAELPYMKKFHCLSHVIYFLELPSVCPEATIWATSLPFPPLFPYYSKSDLIPLLRTLLTSFLSVTEWAVEAWARMRDWLAVHIKQNCARYINIRFSFSSAVLCLLVGDICGWGHCWSICLYRQESGK